MYADSAMRLEDLGIGDPKSTAAVTLLNYLSDRSVALLLRAKSDHLEIGSGCCIEVDGEVLVATAAHNVADLEKNQIDVIAGGVRNAVPIPILDYGWRKDGDVAWLRLDRAMIPDRLRFLRPDQLASIPCTGGLPCLVVGYPAAQVEVEDSIDLEGRGVMTLSVPTSRSRTFTVEYPPHDGSHDADVVPARGFSGGGIFWLQEFDSAIWSPINSPLVAISATWNERTQELHGTTIDAWLDLAKSDLPELF